MSSYTTNDMINNILLTSHIALANSTFSAQDLVTLADRELRTPITNQILSTRQGFYLTYQDYGPTVDGLYNIPPDCIAGSLENVELVVDPTIIPVALIQESEQFSTNCPMATTYGFFMRGNKVQILPFPTVGVTRLWYAQRPSQLILTTDACQITQISGATVTVSSIPSQVQVGQLVDLLGDQPPFNILGTQTILSITGMVITLDLSIDPVTMDPIPIVGLNVGDWVALTKTTCIPQIPVEFRILLEHRVVVQMCKIQGIKDKIVIAEKDLIDIEKDTLNMITSRVRSQTAVINPTNGGFLSGYQRGFTRFSTSNDP